MDYVDTDILIHSLINQNQDLHLKTIDLIEKMNHSGRFIISWLSLQELGFVLAKLGQLEKFIEAKFNALISTLPASYGTVEFARAMTLANIIGYKDFNDCLHTAIAETHCTDLYTANYKDFKRIQPHTMLNIHFL